MAALLRQQPIIGAIPTLPAGVECSGTTLTFNYTVSDNCSTDNCTSTFTVPAAVPIEVTCTAPVNIQACTSLTDIQAAYTTWVAGFSYTGGCAATTTTNIGAIPTLPAGVECSGTTLTFNYTVSDNCSTDNCTSTFTVPAAVPIEVTCTAPVNIQACTSLTDIQAAYTTWVAGFSYTGGCAATTTTNIGAIPTLPAGVECSGTTLTFNYTVSDNCSTDNCTSTFTVPAAVPIEVTCTAPVNIQACTSLG